MDLEKLLDVVERLESFLEGTLPLDWTEDPKIEGKILGMLGVLNILKQFLSGEITFEQAKQKLFDI